MKSQERFLRIAVTGATGFIGRHVLAELALHNIEIIAVARPGRNNLLTLTNGRWVSIDLCHPPANAYALIGSPDILIHLAWQGLPDYRSLHHFETELPLQYAFLKKLLADGLKSIVITGTCFEYGMQSGSLSEDLECRPETPYGFAKDALRKQLQFLKSMHPFNLTWARLFYLYGEGQSPTSLFSQLRKAVDEGKEQFDMSGGEQVRDFLPAEEVARQLVALATWQHESGVVNICSGKPQSVRSLVEGWIAENNWNIKLNLGRYPYPDYEPMAFWGNSSKFKKNHN